MAGPEEGTAAVPFVGRDRELAQVVGLLDESRAGRGRLLLCTGEAGIGKTRLAKEALGGWLAVSSGLMRLPGRKRCWLHNRPR